MKLTNRLLFFVMLVSVILLGFLQPKLYSRIVIGFLVAIICIAGGIMLFRVFVELSDMKRVLDNMKLLEKTKDAKLCTANFEAALEKMRKSGRKETRVAELNVIFGLMYCGEHGRADAMLAEIARTFEDPGRGNDDTMILYGYYHRKIWNDMYMEQYAYVPEAVRECQRIYDSDRKMQQQPMLKLQNAYFAIFRKMAEQNWQDAYDAMQRLRLEYEIVEESVLDDDLHFFEIRILKQLGREEESREMAAHLLGHKVLPCIAAKLNAG